MTSALKFDLGKTTENGVRSILEGLSLDRENVLHAAFDEASRVLHVELTRTDAASHVDSFVSGMKRTHRLIDRKILKQTRVDDLRVRDIDADLANSPHVYLIGGGLTGLSGPILALFRFFEQEFVRIAREFQAEDNHYPAMLPSELLAEVGYFHHFPQHATFCSHLPDSLPVLQSVASDTASGLDKMVANISGMLAETHHVLVPGVCLPCYRQQRGLVLREGTVRTLTMQNHVFRYEGSNFRPLTREWDFSVRDIVFFGTNQDMTRLRHAVIERTLALCEELGLAVTIELANDPFFLDANREKAVYQRMGEVKYELLFPLPHRGDALAASSFNLHRDFYTSVYNTRLASGDLAESACMGFGLERWLYGFLSQKGLDPAVWPDRVQSHLASLTQSAFRQPALR